MMISWFTENSTLPMISGGILVLILLGMAFSAREKVLVYLALAIAALTAATVICERMIVTDNEKVMEAIYEIADAVEDNDRAKVVTYISKTRQDTIDRVNAEMPRYDFSSCRILGTNYFEPADGPPKTIEVSFTVSFQVRLNNDPQSIPGHRKIILTFEQQADGQWRLITYSHENPHSGVTI
jgi:hypothetical protein